MVVKQSVQGIKKVADLIGPTNQIFLMLGFLPLYLVLFRPSLVELLAVILVDTVFALPLLFLVDKFLFTKIFPQAKSYFPRIDETKFTTADTQDIVVFLDAFIRFPAWRFKYVSVLTWIKIIPGALVILFYWEYQGPFSTHFFKLLGAILLIHCYFLAALYIDSHIYISQKITEFHNKYNWSSAFKFVNFPSQKTTFATQENLALIFTWIFTLGLQIYVLYIYRDQGFLTLLSPVLIIGIVGLLLISRIFYISRNYFLGGLESLFKELHNFNPNKVDSIRSVPIHSSLLLAKFEMTYNLLIENLQKYHLELSHWLSRNAEIGRFQAIGEISSLIIHDLTSPIHVMDFCLTALMEKENDPSILNYVSRMKVSCERAKELIYSLRAYLKDDKCADGDTYTPINFKKVYESVLKLIGVRFFDKGLEKINFQVDHNLHDIELKMSRPDLIHIFLNILSNSVENLINHDIKNAEIVLKLEQHTDKQLIISIYDNGTGLKKDDFDRLTGLSFSNLPVNNTSLGLRLVKRLIERHGHQMHLDEGNTVGTKFNLVFNS